MSCEEGSTEKRGIRLDTFQGLVKRVIRALNRTDHEYMFTGALASSYYGTPRSTTDIDIVIRVEDRELHRVSQLLAEARLEIKEDTFERVLDSGYGIVTIRDRLTPYSVDLIMTEEHLERRACTILGEPTYIQSPESLILAKLRMIRATLDPLKSSKDREDIRSIVRHTRVDMERVRSRAEQENTLGILETLDNSHTIKVDHEDMDTNARGIN